jgi:hypothetical protein
MQLLSALGAALCFAAPAAACPLCNSDTGVQIRALAFGPDFLRLLGLTIAPIPPLIALVALAHRIGPWLLDSRRVKR